MYSYEYDDDGIMGTYDVLGYDVAPKFSDAESRDFDGFFIAGGKLSVDVYSLTSELSYSGGFRIDAPSNSSWWSNDLFG